MITKKEIQEAEQFVRDEMEKAFNLPIERVVQAPIASVGVQFPIRDKIMQAINWIDLGAPGRAREVLLEALKAELGKP